MTNTTLWEKLKEMEPLHKISPETLQKFGKMLEECDDWCLHRINPLRFAKDNGFEPDEILNLFVCGVKVGLFDFNWDILCPYCGAIISSESSVDKIADEKFHCAICNLDVPMILDDQIEVAFTVNPNVKKIKINPYQNVANYSRYFFSPNMKRSGPLVEYINEMTLSFTLIEAGQEKEIVFEAEPGRMYRFISVDLHSVFLLKCMDYKAPGLQVFDIHILPGGFASHSLIVGQGRIVLKMKNFGKKSAGFIFSLVDYPRLENILKNHPNQFTKFLTGKMLLNHQTFRDLFRIQSLNEHFKLRIRSLTVLFTDLKGSTQLYDQTGDVYAYQLVQQHFDVLSDSVRKYSGAIVKTMGDAVMATFSIPSDGVNAGMDMLYNLDRMNQKWGAEGHTLGLKIGLHEGPALVVNSEDRLDYFGQNINIAARVQALAQAGEIWVTEPVYRAHDVQDVLARNGYRGEEKHVLLKGVGHETKIYRCNSTSGSYVTSSASV